MSVVPEALHNGAHKRAQLTSPTATSAAENSVQSPITKHFAVTRLTTRASTRKQTAVRRRTTVRKGAAAAAAGQDGFGSSSVEMTTISRSVKKRRRSPRSPSPCPENVSPPGCSSSSSRKRRRVQSSASALKDRSTVLSPITASQTNSRGSGSSSSSSSTSARKKNSRSHNVRKPAAAAASHQAMSDDEPAAADSCAEDDDVNMEEGASKKEEKEDEDMEDDASDGQLTMDFLHRVYDALSTSFVPDELKGREHEHDVIQGFLETCLRKRQANSMILVGSPGVGKTALVNSMLRKLPSWEKDNGLPSSNVISVNAMRFSPPNAIYPYLWNEVSNSKKRVPFHEAARKLEAKFCGKNRSKKMTLVIVDEIDALLESGQATVLYSLFGWPKQFNSTLIVIGISNEIELTNLFLPRLSHRNCSPELLVFDPYTEKQLSAILEHRIAMCAKSGDDDDCLIERNAMTLITKKVASVSGDIRKGLEICRKAFRKLAEKAAADSGANPEAATAAIRVRFLDVMSVVRSFFASPFVDVVRSLPNHQQTALCVAVIMDREARGRDIAIGDFLEFFSDLTKRWDIARPALGEFWDMIQALASHGLVSVSQSKKSKKASSSQSGSGSGTGTVSGKKSSSASSSSAVRTPRFAKPKKRSVKALQRTMSGDSRKGVLHLIVAADDVVVAVEGNHMLARLLGTRVEVPSKYYT